MISHSPAVKSHGSIMVISSSSLGQCFAYERSLLRSQQMREFNVELNDKVALLAWLVGVRHSLTGYRLLVARTVTTTHVTVTPLAAKLS